MDGEVAPAQVGRRDVGDERLVRRAVEAFACAQEPGRKRERDERGRRVEPRAGAVDEQPGDRPEGRHQRQGAHAAAALDPV